MYFLETERLGFGRWDDGLREQARTLWGDPMVTRLIGAPEGFTPEQIDARLRLEEENQRAHDVQYWPVFLRETGDLVGCCGLRPAGEKGVMELGYHLRPRYWHMGLATEAGRAVVRYAFEALGVSALEAGHHPDNDASARVLARLGFRRIGTQYYPPTGLQHPTYRLP